MSIQSRPASVSSINVASYFLSKGPGYAQRSPHSLPITCIFRKGWNFRKERRITRSLASGGDESQEISDTVSKAGGMPGHYLRNRVKRPYMRALRPAPRQRRHFLDRNTRVISSPHGAWDQSHAILYIPSIRK